MWPFRKKKINYISDDKDFSTEKFGEFLEIKSIDFFGPFAKSPNDQYTLAWSDSDKSTGRGGFRDSGEGPFVLLERGNLILEGKMERPNDGKVANNGTFILNDWMFGEGLKGTFYAIDIKGNILVKKLFNANLLNNGISDDGMYGICQTCNSEHEDGSKLTLYNLVTRETLWQQYPETGWADSYEFDLDSQLVFSKHRDLGKFAHKFSGEFIDSEKWEIANVESGNVYFITELAKSKLKELGTTQTQEVRDEIIALLNKALKQDMEDKPNEKAMIYRIKGEVNQIMGEIPKAIEYFEKALKLNPKVGVKRKLEDLKKAGP